MRKKDLDAQLADIERRRLLGKLSYEEAILAKQKLTEENRAKVAQMKKEVCCGFCCLESGERGWEGAI